jgi:hypothetical protein
LCLSPDGRSFRFANGDPVDLTRKRALRLVLLRLVAHREAEPGVALSQDEVLAAGWPGQRMDVESGSQRVRTAIWTLRKLGLGTQLVTHDDGYLLEPSVMVRHEPTK